MTTSALPLATTARAGAAASQVDIVIPVTSQQRDLALTVIRLHAFITGTFPFTARVTIADGGTSTGTRATASDLAASFGEVSAVPAGAPGRGAALRAAWARSQCEVLAYLDPDLSIDLTALVPLVEPLLQGHSDLTVGTRLTPGARPQRGPRREVTSCGYSLLVQAGLGTGLADVQCGCKAITRRSARELLPLTSDAGWFFDTELLTLADRAGLRIQEVGVRQSRDPGPHPGRPRLRGLLPGRFQRGNAA